MKRLVASIVLLLVCDIAFAQANALKFSVPNVEAATGAEVQIPIAIKDATSVGAVHAELLYDPAVLEYRSIAKGPLMSGGAMLDSNNTSGRLIIGVVSLEPVNGEGVAVNARFIVKGASGSTSTLKLENLRAWDNKSHADLLVHAEDGTFRAVDAAASSPSFLSGDKLPWLIAGGAVALLLVVLVFRKSGQPR